MELAIKSLTARYHNLFWQTAWSTGPSPTLSRLEYLFRYRGHQGIVMTLTRGMCTLLMPLPETEIEPHPALEGTSKRG